MLGDVLESMGCLAAASLPLVVIYCSLVLLCRLFWAGRPVPRLPPHLNTPYEGKEMTIAHLPIRAAKSGSLVFALFP